MRYCMDAFDCTIQGRRVVMYSLIDLIMTAFSFLVIGISGGILLVITAKDDEEPLEEAFNAGYEKGKVDEQKRVMQKLEEWEKTL